MIRLNSTNGGTTVKATFTLPADEPGSRVAVVGDFNDWLPDATVLRRRGNRLSASVVLERGRRYAFRYRTADGTWFDDGDATVWEDNGFGGANGVIDLTDHA